MDGDGAADQICHYRNNNGGVAIAYSVASKPEFRPPVPPPQIANISWCYPSATTPNPKLFVGDFDGDGRSDLLCHDFTTGTDYLLFARNGGVFEEGHANWISGAGAAWCYGTGFELLTGEFNGDGLLDLLCHFTGAQPPQGVNPGALWIRTARVVRGPSDQWSPFLASFDWQSNNAGWGFCAGPNAVLRVGDIDGDGLDDLLCHESGTGNKWVSFNKANRRMWPGNPVFTSVPDWSGALNWCTGTGSGDIFELRDIDGDGAADMLCHNPTTGISWISRAQGQREQPFPAQPGTSTWTRATPWCSGSPTPRLVIGDFDGDGRSDLLCHKTTSGISDNIEYVPLPGM